MARKREAEEARREEKKRMEAKARAKAIEDAVVWRRQAEETVAFATRAKLSSVEHQSQ